MKSFNQHNARYITNITKGSAAEIYDIMRYYKRRKIYTKGRRNLSQQLIQFNKMCGKHHTSFNKLG